MSSDALSFHPHPLQPYIDLVFFNMSTLFCCPDTRPYRPRALSHEPKFTVFMKWAAFPREATAQSAGEQDDKLAALGYPHVIQLVKQVNFGPLEAKRYFAATNKGDEEDAFVEVTESDLIAANYKKLNAYKNFKCSNHNKFFEVNVYEKDPFNAHHWRQNIARPGSEIDL
ncbi:mfs multidrug transporter [Diplodia corticola]|uniref:Mfs multidrug transporter n=1 Tax=Diplodia corticola TaxID=236234 RepID=A0A1J9S657_9PEZI|nr:mfs multidrug transporter [Diplodia corticola]OJD36007.1 mfs multidrug transporter [Diplodia corticola]